MGKGVLLEVNGRQGTVLTPTGEFKSVRLAAAARVGEEVDFADSAAGAGLRWGWLAAAAVIFLALVVPLTMSRTYIGPAVALVAVDINPSVEFEVSAANRVVVARARNADGQEILKELPAPRGRNVDDVVAEFTDAAVRKGYLKPADAEAAVMITVAPVEGKAGLAGAREQALEQKLQAATQQVVAEKYSGTAQVHTVGATAQDKAAADELDVPLGKYLQYEAARALEPSLELSPGQIREMKLGQIRQAIKKNDTLSILDQVHDQQEKKGKGQGEGNSGKDSDNRGKGSDNRGQGSDNRGQGSDNSQGRPPVASQPGEPKDTRNTDDGRADNRGRKDDARKDDARKDDARKDDARKDDARKDDARKDDARKDTISITLPVIGTIDLPNPFSGRGRDRTEDRDQRAEDRSGDQNDDRNRSKDRAREQEKGTEREKDGDKSQSGRDRDRSNNGNSGGQSDTQGRRP